ncbi:SufD family Fe-S cluster assembly protein [Clostridium sp. HBUAS56010]|uniref:SufB/SufD family protein n=1 Tax=Clostridium sp. HBUAS56010 TaxID=2571127 RepID=UPI0011783DB3|nr:SufD family Fe-S cluster assembly protein [Clostridium sp. HBUAS56010]
MNEKINILPVPTWNRTGVNWADEKANLPENTFLPGKKIPYNGEVPDGIHCADTLSEELSAIESGMGEYFDGYLKDRADKTCFLTIDKKVKNSFVMTEIIDPKRPVSRTHMSITAAEGSHLTVVQISRGDAPDGAYMNLTQIDAKAGSSLHLIQIQLLGNQSRSWEAVGARIGEGAQVKLTRAVLGGSVAACGSLALLEEQKGNYELKTAYFGHQEQYLDFNDIARHIGRETTCEMDTSGVLADESSKILRGTIDFCSGASHSVGHENETVLLLSPKARNRTAPLILCGEEQVEGQHAATLGRFDEKQLYYLCSRGLTPLEAKRMMVEARFAPVLDMVPDKALKDEILEYIERRLNSHEKYPE